jgi:hypothetical protein
MRTHIAHTKQHKWDTHVDVTMVFVYGVIRTIITLRITKTVSQSWQVPMRGRLASQASVLTCISCQ